MSALLALDLAYWQQSLVRVLVSAIAIPTVAATLVYVFLFKFVSFMHSRLGPMEAGPHGSLQLVAEVGKWLQKEDIFPEQADRTVFAAAPVVVLVATFLMFLVVPAGPNAIAANLDAGIYYVLAASSISVIGILMAGWSSSNKYALLGGLRAAGQLVAYELPMVLAVVGVVIQAGSLNLQKIVYAQSGGEMFGFSGLGNPFAITQLVGFAIFMISIQAELAQTPFDMPIAESEIVGGYMVEYSGLRFLMFFIAEFATVGGFGAIAATLFLGGWALPASWGVPVGAMHVIGPLVLLLKIMAMALVVFWVRFSFPRFREDQLQKLAWKVLIPLALANIMATAVLKVVF